MLVVPLSRLPLSRTPMEEIVVQRVLREFLEKLRRVVHTNFQTRIGCHCEIDRLPQAVWTAEMTASQVVRSWEARVHENFARLHDPVSAAKALIVQNLASPLSMTALAKAVGVGQRTLERQFRERSQETPVQFRTRYRVSEATRWIARGMKREAAAHAVGWKNKKDLYRGFRQVYGGLAPRTRITD